MKRITTWFLIADGTRARIAFNDGPGRGIKPVFDQEFQGRNLASRDIVSDRPGRTFDSGGEGRHAKEPPSDPRELEKRNFARGLTQRLDEAAHRGDFDRLVLVAPPRVLGNLRALLSAKARTKVTQEIRKDLTQITLRELEDHLGEMPI
jgi:protein required for attachment to host cells